LVTALHGVLLHQLYAIKVPQRIILIDGEELTRLMVQYGVGVRIERNVEIKRIDLDYFDEGDE
jgi:restriction system protein